MLFKTTRIGSEYPTLHKDLREKLSALETYLKAWSLPGLTITDAQRTVDEQEALYLPVYRKQGASEDDARKLARHRFSWHLLGCAADFRSSGPPWSKAATGRVNAWLKVNCPGALWEVLEHDLGTGLHFHLARRDFLARRHAEQGGSANG